MKNPRLASLLLSLLFVFACEKSPPDLGKPSDNKAPTTAAAAHASVDPALTQNMKPQIPPPPDVKAPPGDAEKTASGLASKVLQRGTGTVHPQPDDSVRVHYTGWQTDGKMFDSSVQRGEPITFPLNGVIKGWTEGVGLMVVGEKRRLWIPEDLAYKGQPGRPQGMLVFDVELLEIKTGPKAPADVAAPPPDAQKTKSGLASKVLVKGKGKDHPTETDTVKAQFSGWTTDGKLFKTTTADPEPPLIPVNAVNKGWTEALQLMVVGEKRRVWIPEELGFKGKPGAPPGMIVMDIELLEIKSGAKIPVPADVTAPPAGAIKEKDGLASQILTKGKGTAHPGPKSEVMVNYTGWTTDGKQFDSSVARGQPATFTLDGVIKGWTEGVQLMVEGEKRRFWIPVELAYNNQPGMPAGMLVFDVELLKITKP